MAFAQAKAVRTLNLGVENVLAIQLKERWRMGFAVKRRLVFLCNGRFAVMQCIGVPNFSGAKSRKVELEGFYDNIIRLRVVKLYNIIFAAALVGYNRFCTARLRGGFLFNLCAAGLLNSVSQRNRCYLAMAVMYIERHSDIGYQYHYR